MQNPFLGNVENLVPKIFGGRGQKYVKKYFVGNFENLVKNIFGGMAKNFQKNLGAWPKNVKMFVWEISKILSKFFEGVANFGALTFLVP